MPETALLSTRPATGLRLPFVLLRLAILGMVCGAIVLHRGFPEPPLPSGLLRVIELCLLGVYIVFSLWRLRDAPTPMEKVRQHWFEWGLIGVIVVDLALMSLVGLVVGLGEIRDTTWRVIEVSLFLMLAYQGLRLYVALVQRATRPALVLPASFLSLILVGTVLLKVPAATPEAHPISWLDALFTATSAVCVTGLIVRDTATEFTRYGHVVLLMLFQLGGLGIMIFGSMLAALFGQRQTLRESVNVRAALAGQPLSELPRLIRFIIITALGLELIGALVLMALWAGPEYEHLDAFDAVFFAVSGFCNAGFATLSDSLESFRHAQGTLTVIGTLVVLGGLGFPVLYNLYRVGRHRMAHRDDHGHQPTGPNDRLTLQSKLILSSTMLLVLGGGVVFFGSQMIPHFYGEAPPAMAAAGIDVEPLTIENVSGHFFDGTFQSVAARTAGFNSMPMDEMTAGGIFVLMVLMFIGGGPASTAGGIKTVVFAVLVLSVIATLRGRPGAEAFGRSIGLSLINQAGTIVLVFFAMVTACTALLCLTETAPLQVLLFEAISACGTVGLSLGVTGDLTPYGRVVVILSMFAGRVGPLVILSALLANRQQPGGYRYAREAVVLG